MNRTDVWLRWVLVMIVGTVTALLVFGLELLRQGADSDAEAWARMPVRSAAQLGDIAPGTALIQPVMLAEPNDGTGLAVYTRQHEERYTTTEPYTVTESCTVNGKPSTCTATHSRTVTKERWVDDQRVWPAQLRTRTLADDAGRSTELVVQPGYQPVGMMRYQALPVPYGSAPQRAVGWAEGDALLLVGQAGARPGTIAAPVVTSESYDSFIRGKQAGAWMLVVLMWAVAGMGLFGMGWVLLRGASDTY